MEGTKRESSAGTRALFLSLTCALMTTNLGRGLELLVNKWSLIICRCIDLWMAKPLIENWPCDHHTGICYSLVSVCCLIQG